MATNNTAIPFTVNQLATITRLGEAKAYPAMYQYIADLIKTGAIPVAGGINSDQYYWFDQASRINQNDTSSPASVFIRAATKYGLSIDKKPTTNEYIQAISNDIGSRVFSDIKRNQGLPEFSSQLQNDISAALNRGQMTIGGWGGAFYYWDEAYITPQGVKTTVGNAILSNAAEKEKFIAINSKAMAEVVAKFGTSIFQDTNAGKALVTGWKNFGVNTSVERNSVGLSLIMASMKEITIRSGVQPAREWYYGLISNLGLQLYNTLGRTDQTMMVIEELSNLFEAETYGGGVDSSSEFLVNRVKEKLGSLLADKDLNGVQIYEFYGTGERGTNGVLIVLRSGELIAVDAGGNVAYNLIGSGVDGTVIWNTKGFNGHSSKILIRNSHSTMHTQEDEDIDGNGVTDITTTNFDLDHDGYVDRVERLVQKRPLHNPINSEIIKFEENKLELKNASKFWVIRNGKASEYGKRAHEGMEIN